MLLLKKISRIKKNEPRKIEYNRLLNKDKKLGKLLHQEKFHSRT